MHDSDQSAIRVDPLPTAESFLTQREAACLLRLSERTLERWRVAGDGPPFRAFGRRKLYGRRDLIEWADTRRRRSTSEPDAV